MSAVRELCRRMGVRQRNLAESLGLNPAQVNVYFQGKSEMRADRMIALLKILGIDIEKQVYDKIRELGGEVRTVSDNRVLASLGGLNESKKKSLLRMIKIFAAEPKRLDEPAGEREKMLELVKSEIRNNYDFALFSILPGLTSDLRSIKRFAKQLGVESEKVELFIGRLIGAGLWIVEGKQVRSNFDFLDLGDLTVKDYLTTTVGIASKLSDAKSHNFDTLSIVTNHALVRSFRKTVNQALRDLHRLSQAQGALKEVIFSWSHTGVVEVQKKNIESMQKTEENLI